MPQRKLGTIGEVNMKIEIRRVESTDDGDYHYCECTACESELGCSNDGAYVLGMELDILCIGCAIKELAKENEELAPDTFWLNNEYVRGTVKGCLLEGLGDSICKWAGKRCGFYTHDYPKTVNKIHAEFTQKYAKQIEQLGLPRGLIEENK
jgi:hypothetical protein